MIKASAEKFAQNDSYNDKEVKYVNEVKIALSDWILALSSSFFSYSSDSEREVNKLGLTNRDISACCVDLNTEAGLIDQTILGGSTVYDSISVHNLFEKYLLELYNDQEGAFDVTANTFFKDINDKKVLIRKGDISSSFNWIDDNYKNNDYKDVVPIILVSIKIYFKDQSYAKTFNINDLLYMLTVKDYHIFNYGKIIAKSSKSIKVNPPVYREVFDRFGQKFEVGDLVVAADRSGFTYPGVVMRITPTKIGVRSVTFQNNDPKSRKVFLDNSDMLFDTEQVFLMKDITKDLFKYIDIEKTNTEVKNNFSF